MANTDNIRGDICVDDAYIDDQRPDVFAAALTGEFSTAPDCPGGYEDPKYPSPIPARRLSIA
jgi:hypothetical protein